MMVRHTNARASELARASIGLSGRTIAFKNFLSLDDIELK